jgi:hypothetical protein
VRASHKGWHDLGRAALSELLVPADVLCLTELQQSMPSGTRHGELSGLLSVSMTFACVEDKREEVTL